MDCGLMRGTRGALPVTELLEGEPFMGEPGPDPTDPGATGGGTAARCCDMSKGAASVYDPSIFTLIRIAHGEAPSNCAVCSADHSASGVVFQNAGSSAQTRGAHASEAFRAVRRVKRSFVPSVYNAGLPRYTIFFGSNLAFTETRAVLSTKSISFSFPVSGISSLSKPNR